MKKRSFETLVKEALAQEFSGWDFSWMRRRYFESEPYWDYRELVMDRIKNISSMLDMGTGGGEFLASLPGLPLVTYATEGYPPNIPIATRRLQPLGVKVVAVEDENNLQLPDLMFDLVINRHEYYDPAEIMRILKPGGIFLTQQVGPRNCVELNQYLGAPIDANVVHWKLDQEIGALEQAGFTLLQSNEQILESNFFDIGAVVFYLKVIEWQIEGFSVEKYEARLREMHQLIEKQGAFYASEHRFLIEAQKPG